MRLHAYVLAADPTWLRTSVSRYYDAVERIVVSYDVDSLGWTGAPVEAERCLQALREIDTAGKLVLSPGSHHHHAAAPSRGDTEQRAAAVREAAVGADWVLQIDTDEVLPDVAALRRVLAHADEQGLRAVEWPMRVLYRRLRGGRYLEVRGPGGELHVEYPGPIAVRAGAEPVDCRRTGEPFLRPVVRGDRTSLQVTRPTEPGEHREELLEAAEAIWHNSWARRPGVVRRKIRSWGHSQGRRSELYYRLRWWPAPVSWRLQRDLHPFAGGLWPRLGVVAGLPFALHPEEAA